jgi:hypothetical protein
MSKPIFYRARGGEIRTGTFLGFIGPDRMRVVTGPGSKVPTTIMSRDRILTAEDVCRLHNRMWWSAREIVEHS